MAKWHWLAAPPTPYRWGFVRRVIVKAALLFVAFNLLFALLRPVETLGSISLYNVIVPGRERLPYGENPAQSYTLSLNTLSAMFASHVISRPKPADEYRVLLIGDSATWGWRLENVETLAAVLNRGDLQTGDGQRVVVYNLGYPIMSLTKDLLLLDSAMHFAPDLVIWLVTLESFPTESSFSAAGAAQRAVSAPPDRHVPTCP
ncbi:hypothetical protein HC928_13840 [bacterium]|nr:hypothetical protein [bacterium]